MDIINNVIRAMDGDQEAISELYYTTYQKLRAVAVSILKNEDDADDIVQDSYIKAFSSLHQLDNAKKFEPWLCRIVSNKCKDYLKKNKPILFSSQDNEENDEPVEWSIEDESKEYNPEEVLVSEDTRKQIMDLLDSLPDDQRICLVYHVVQEMKISEIAELLEVSESTVKSRINYAKSKMKIKINELEKKGVKLRGFAGFALFPFLRHLFASKSVSIPPISTEIVTSSVASAAETTTAVAETIAPSSSVVATTSATVGVTAAKVGLGAKIMSLPLVTKIISSIVAVAIIISTPILIKNINTNKSTSSGIFNDSSADISSETNIIETLSEQELTQLNRYLSYFSEQRFVKYPASDEELYDFSFIYNKINTDNLTYESGTVYEYAYCIDKTIIDNTITKFFDISIDDISTEFVTLQNGIYYNMAADGETYPYISIARQLYKKADNVYQIVFDVFKIINLDSNPVPEHYYALDTMSADIESSAEKQNDGIITVVKNAKGNYVVKEYEETDMSPSTNSEDAVPEEDGDSTETSSVTETPVTKPTCSHEKYFKDDGGLHFIGGWADREPGVENRFELYAECTEKRHVVYKCPQCLEPVLYEELEALGHDFSGEETVLLYPSVSKAGSYGKTCQRDLCNETMLTTTIPKRTGDYSTIDSCFTVGVSGIDNQEYYQMEDPDIYISDARTWGSVPTITYDTQKNIGTIEFLGQDGTVITHTITVDFDLISQGYGYYGKILENGQYETKYSRWAFNGTAS
ncbi:MAG: RNA polymerase sigma factor [Clostridia bacterium]|nr:RNA polymerase sigma factor [Clostridia bacterium]